MRIQKTGGNDLDKLQLNLDTMKVLAICLVNEWVLWRWFFEQGTQTGAILLTMAGT